MIPVEKIASTKRTSQLEKINAKKRRAQIFQDIDEGRSARMALLRDIAQRNSSTPSVLVEDPIDIFFKSLAATAKTLSPRYLAEAKRKLFLVMADIEEININEKYPSGFPSSNPCHSSRYPPTSPSSLSECPSASPSPFSVLPPMSSPDDSSSASHAGQTQYGNPGPFHSTTPEQTQYGHPGPSYSTTSGQTEYEHSGPSYNKPCDQKIPPDCTLNSYLATYIP